MKHVRLNYAKFCQKLATKDSHMAVIKRDVEAASWKQSELFAGDPAEICSSFHTFLTHVCTI